jgi:hypothetical protein
MCHLLGYLMHLLHSNGTASADVAAFVSLPSLCGQPCNDRIHRGRVICEPHLSRVSSILDERSTGAELGFPLFRQRQLTLDSEASTYYGRYSVRLAATDTDCVVPGSDDRISVFGHHA